MKKICYNSGDITFFLGDCFLLAHPVELFDHIARAEPAQDHARTLRASISRLPGDWRRPKGRPCQSWLRTVEADLKPLSFGLRTACRRAARAADRSAGGVGGNSCPWMGVPPHDDEWYGLV